MLKYQGEIFWRERIKICEGLSGDRRHEKIYKDGIEYTISGASYYRNTLLYIKRPEYVTDMGCSDDGSQGLDYHCVSARDCLCMQ